MEAADFLREFGCIDSMNLKTRLLNILYIFLCCCHERLPPQQSNRVPLPDKRLACVFWRVVRNSGQLVP